MARLAGHAAPEPIDTVLFQIRLPRVLAALLVGAALAAAGASYQTLFRNPLVSPDILGVSAGAGFGAVLGILLSLPVIAIQGLGFVDRPAHRRHRLHAGARAAQPERDPRAGAGRHRRRRAWPAPASRW